MTLRLKLYLAFISTIVLALLACGLSLWSMRQVDTQVVGLTERTMPVVRAVLSMKIAMYELQTQERLYMLANDDDSRTLVDKKRLAALANYDAMRAEVGRVDRDGSHARELAAIDGLMQRYLEASKVVIGLSGQGNNSAANTKLSAVSMPLLAEMTGALDKIAAQAGAATRLASTTAGQAYERAVTLTSIGLGAMLLVSGFLAWRIPASVLRQIGADPRYAVDVVRRIARGELQVEVQTREGDQSSLLWEMKAMVSSLAGLVTAVRQSAGDIHLAAAEVAGGNQDLSQRTEQQAARIQKTASSLLSLGDSVSRTAEAAQGASALATSATDVVRRGHDVVRQVESTMDTITEASRRIADITGVIDGIAFQTNILALNAAVEAARAGEQGRGFAVVASEVRTLAQRSAGAAKEIKTLIATSAERVETGARLVGDTGRIMDEIVQSISGVNGLIGDVSGAAAAQGQSIGEINESVAQIENSTQQNSALVEQSAAAAASMKSQANRLAEAIQVFKVAS